MAEAETLFQAISTHSDDINVLYVTDDDLKLSNSESGGTTLFAGPGVLPPGFNKDVQVSTDSTLTFWIKRHPIWSNDWQSIVQMGIGGWGSHGKSGDSNWGVHLPPAYPNLDCGPYIRILDDTKFDIFKSGKEAGCIPGAQSFRPGHWTYVAIAFTSTNFDIRINGLPFASGLFPKERIQSSAVRTLRVGGQFAIQNKKWAKQNQMEIAHLTYYNSASHDVLDPPQGIGKYVANTDDAGACKFPQAAYLTDQANKKGVCVKIAQDSSEPFCFIKGTHTACTKQVFAISHLENLVYAMRVTKNVHCFPQDPNVVGGKKKCDVTKNIGCYVSLRAHWSEQNNGVKSCKDKVNCVPTFRESHYPLGPFEHPELKGFTSCQNLTNASAYIANHQSLQRKCKSNNIIYDCPMFGTKEQGAQMVKELLSITEQTAMTA